MSYRNDQWWGLNSAGENLGWVARPDGKGRKQWTITADNPPFAYPDRTIRTIDGKGNLVSVPMKRGYIRSLETLTGDGSLSLTKAKKCAFQFNPQFLQHGVQASQAERNPYLMSLEDLAQPMATGINFGFDILFDRQMELNNPRPNPNFDPNDPWMTGDPSQVGVLRDLAVLYEVIGQGWSQANVALSQSLASNASSPVQEQVLAAGEANLGNVTYLMPNKFVRVVFSGLYIVEGFINNTNTTFTKFTTNYVPSQVQVSLSMEAKYVGFAKKNTTVTYIIDQGIRGRINDANAQISAKNDVINAMRNVIPSVNVTRELTPQGWKHELTFPTAKSVLSKVKLNFDDPASSTFDSVSHLLQDGIITSISVNSTASLFGPFLYVPGTSYTQEKMAGIVSHIFTPTQGDNVYGSMIAASQIVPNPRTDTNLAQDGIAKAENMESWVNMVRKGVLSGNVYVSGDSLDGVDYPNALIIQQDIRINVAHNGDTLTGKGILYTLVDATGVALNGIFSEAEVAITWPDEVAAIEGVTDASGPVVAPDNATSVVNQTSPGNVSRVGAPKGVRRGSSSQVAI